jgi:hypothetical protein
LNAQECRREEEAGNASQRAEKEQSEEGEEEFSEAAQWAEKVEGRKEKGARWFGGSVRQSIGQLAGSPSRQRAGTLVTL